MHGFTVIHRALRVCALVLCCACSGSGPHHEGLRYGMSIAEARDAIGCDPCFVASWNGGAVACFHRRSSLGFDEATSCRPDPAAIASAHPVERRRDLPDRYGHLQLLFDRSGGLVADTMVAESDHVSTRDGDLRGIADLLAIPDDVYAKLLGE